MIYITHRRIKHMLQLKNLRKKAGITQMQLSEYMVVTQATLSGWENEKFEIDTVSLKKLQTISTFR